MRYMICVVCKKEKGLRVAAVGILLSKMDIAYVSKIETMYDTATILGK